MTSNKMTVTESFVTGSYPRWVLVYLRGQTVVSLDQKREERGETVMKG